MVVALTLLPLVACTDEPDDTGRYAFAPPTITWNSPTDGATVAVGDVACSTIVHALDLHDPAKGTEHAPRGYVGVSVDGAEVLRSGTTRFTLTLSAGAHDLAAALFYEDGVEMSANADGACPEDDVDPTCVPVAATIGVTAE